MWPNLDLTQLTGVAVIGVMFILVNTGLFEKLAAGIKNFRSGSKVTGATVPTRRQMLDYLDASYAYFESIGCKEGMDAINTAVDHAFKKHEAPVA